MLLRIHDGVSWGNATIMWALDYKLPLEVVSIENVAHSITRLLRTLSIGLVKLICCKIAGSQPSEVVVGSFSCVSSNATREVLLFIYYLFI